MSLDLLWIENMDPTSLVLQQMSSTHSNTSTTRTIKQTTTCGGYQSMGWNICLINWKKLQLIYMTLGNINWRQQKIIIVTLLCHSGSRFSYMLTFEWTLTCLILVSWVQNSTRTFMCQYWMSWHKNKAICCGWCSTIKNTQANCSNTTTTSNKWTIDLNLSDCVSWMSFCSCVTNWRRQYYNRSSIFKYSKKKLPKV